MNYSFLAKINRKKLPPYIVLLAKQHSLFFIFFIQKLKRRNIYIMKPFLKSLPNKHYPIYSLKNSPSDKFIHVFETFIHFQKAISL